MELSFSWEASNSLANQEIPSFCTEYENLLPLSQEPVSGLYSERIESKPHTHPISLKISFNIILTWLKE